MQAKAETVGEAEAGDVVAGASVIECDIDIDI